jgi:hypothetical protein
MCDARRARKPLVDALFVTGSPSGDRLLAPRANTARWKLESLLVSFILADPNIFRYVSSHF